MFQHPLFAEIRGSDATLGSDANFLQLHIQAEQVFRIARNGICCCAMSSASPWCRTSASCRRSCGSSPAATTACAASPTTSSRRLEPVCSQTKPVRSLRRSATAARAARRGTVKNGGKDLITGTVEVIRDLPRNFGVATFFDYGNAFNRFGGTPLEYAAGVGFRVRLPVVTLGIDIAQPLSRQCRPAAAHQLLAEAVRSAMRDACCSSSAAS